MNARVETLPAFGQIVHGGHYHGCFQLGSQIWGEVTAPKAGGEVKGMLWHPKHIDIPGACSAFDGMANTLAMAEAGSPLAQWALEQRIAGLDDWYVVGRAGALMQYENLQALLPDEEKFDVTRWHQTSTQFDRFNAYYQDFGDGSTYWNYESWDGGSARLVRRFLIQ